MDAVDTGGAAGDAIGAWAARIVIDAIRAASKEINIARSFKLELPTGYTC